MSAGPEAHIAPCTDPCSQTDAADEDDITGLDVDEDIWSWKFHILSARDNYERKQQGLPDDEDVIHIPILAGIVDEERASARPRGPLLFRQMSAYLGIGPNAMIQKSFA